MKKLFLKFLFLLPIPITMLVVNLLVDPGNLFEKSYERQIAKLLIEQKNVVNAVNYDDRLLLKYVVDSLPTPDVLVIGSSRSMQIGNEIIERGNLFNASVAGASYHDLVGIYSLYKERKKLPRKLILTIDPWTFNESYDSERWFSLKENYNRLQVVLSKGEASLTNDSGYKKYIELLSPSYFQKSLEVIKDSDKKLSQPEAYSSNIIPEKGMVKIDGSLIYPKKTLNITDEKVLKKAKKYISGRSVYGLKNFHRISNKRFDDICSLIDLIENSGIEVVIFLAPYHPIVYDYFSKREEYNNVIQSELILKNYCKLNKISILGSYNPENVDASSSDFYDAMHPKREFIKRLFK